MQHRNEQPTLFELTACDDSEPVQGLAAGHASRSVISKSDPSTPEGNVSSGAGVFTGGGSSDATCPFSGPVG